MPNTGSWSTATSYQECPAPHFPFLSGPIFVGQPATSPGQLFLQASDASFFLGPLGCGSANYQFFAAISFTTAISNLPVSVTNTLPAVLVVPTSTPLVPLTTNGGQWALLASIPPGLVGVTLTIQGVHIWEDTFSGSGETRMLYNNGLLLTIQ